MNEASPSRRERRIAALLLLVSGVALAWTEIRGLPEVPYSQAFHDELHYAQQARDFAQGEFPRFNRIFAPFVPPLYGLVLAPARALAGHDGFVWWSRVVNVLLLVSALVPIHCLARRFLRPGWAATAALLAVVAPSLVFERYLLSESLFLPLFLWLVLAVARLLERPTLARGFQLGLVAGLCYLTRSIVIATLPAGLLAFLWVVRKPAAQLRACLGIALGGLLSVLPWTLRAVVFPSERGLEPAFSYLESLLVGGAQPIGTYLSWTWKTLACFLIGLGPAAFLLGLVGLLQGVAQGEPARRGLALFALVGTLGTWLLVTFVTVQWGATGLIKLHERYLMPCWPVFVVAFVAALRAPRVPRSTLALAAALVLAVLFSLPADCFSETSGTVNPVDFPSSPLALWIAGIAGGVLGAKLVYLGLTAPVLLVLAGRRWATPVLLVLFAAYQGYGAWLALRRADGRNAATEWEYRPVWQWLDGIVEEGDLILHHHLPRNFAYQTAMRYEMDYCQLDENLVPLYSSSLRLDEGTGRYRYFDGSAPGRLFLLTNVASDTVVPGTVTRDGLHLIPVSEGIGLLGDSLGQAGQGPTVDGRAPDGWCGRNVRLELIGAYPSLAELAASVSLPDGFPSDRPVSVCFLREGELIHCESLTPGVTWAFYLTETLWAPRVSLAFQADSDALVDGRRVAFRMSEPVMHLGTRSPAEDQGAVPPPTGIQADQWCERTVRARFPPLPTGIRFQILLSHPPDSPVEGPIAIALQVNERELAEVVLEKGSQHLLIFTAQSDLVPLDFVLQADRDALLDGRRVAFRLGALPDDD